ncbi:arginine--tRNA ligase [Streptomyces tubbatahanensis]|uniref:Arginine--tRNA ligase n=1 Tax=Streptomyces tubbatahanensis TaxID=2923272 RepID=A0ABY3Y3R2_9ACTN|nr:DALR anticodon-binding domain-containing protein [Streptomyces tubbatahanensis]UNT01217.1 arginine--tRNA ligase [Streptomyces tubbatahanensis]
MTSRCEAASRRGATGETPPAGAAPKPLIADARVVGGGFVNVTLTPRARAALVRGLVAGRPAGAPDPVAEPGVVPSDAPARDISRWAECTGESPAALAVRTERASSLFRVQYAHARSCSLLRNGSRLGVEPVAEDAEPLVPAGARLLALLADRARVTAPARLARHLDAVAAAFAVFQETAEPLPRGEEKPGAAHRGRLALAEATGAVLAGGLSQLGVTAPAHI